MRAAWLFVIGAVSACTSAGAVVDDYTGEPSEGGVVPDTAPTDGGGLADSATSEDATVSPDSEYFPETCSPDVLCPNGPFEPSTPGGSLDPRTQITVIRGRSANDVWAAGAVGALAHFDGTTWRRVDLATQETMLAVWLLDDAEAVLGDLKSFRARGIAPLDAGAPSGDWTMYSPAFAAGQLIPISSSLAFVGAGNGPGAEWLWGAVQGQIGSTIGGLWRVRRTEAGEFAAARGITSNDCNSTKCYRVTSIHGASANRLWAVGSAGVAIRIDEADGAAPIAKSFNTQTWNALNGVWETSETDAWAVGSSGTIRHYTGDPSLWEIVEGIPTTVQLNAVWASSPTDVWAVGDAAVVLHYDGTTWSRVKIAGLGVNRPKLTTIWGAAPGQFWVGGKGVILSMGARP